jgi:hypothetical protein
MSQNFAADGGGIGLPGSQVVGEPFGPTSSKLGFLARLMLLAKLNGGQAVAAAGAGGATLVPLAELIGGAGASAVVGILPVRASHLLDDTMATKIKTNGRPLLTTLLSLKFIASLLEIYMFDGDGIRLQTA